MYRLYIDETGNADKGIPNNSNQQFLSLTGIMIDLEYSREEVSPKLEILKTKFFNSHPDDPVILHRKEIIAKTGPFLPLRDYKIELAFNADFIVFLTALDYSVLTVVIDKGEHLTRYKVWQQDPYHFCLEAMMELYVRFLSGRKERGDVIAEARGAKPDQLLQRYYVNLYANGGSTLTKKAMISRMTSTTIRFRAKAANVAGLQIADLIANPSACYVRSIHGQGPAPSRFGESIAALLVAQKYRRSSRNVIEGFGIKWLP